MSADISASQRALSLLAMLLFGRKPYSLKQLAESLECSRQTILRLMDEIGRLGWFSIEKWKKDGQNWYALAMPENRTNISLSKDELAQIVACRDMQQHLLSESQRQALNVAVGKIACLTRLPKVSVETAATVVVKGSIDYDPHEDGIRKLLEAQATKQVLEIEYLARLKAESRIHAFVPVRLVAFHDGLYVRGWRVTDKGTVEIISPMTLAVHRILTVWETCRVLHEEKEFPTETPAFGMATEASPFQVCAAFFPPASVYISERQWSADQHLESREDGSAILTFTAQSEYEVVKWILSFGKEAKLLFPEQLRAKVVKELTTAIGLYG